MPQSSHYFFPELGHELFAYHGPVTNFVISEIGQGIRLKLGTRDKASRKVFSVFMELVQNMSYYSEDKVPFDDKHHFGVGKVIVRQNEEHYVIECVNVVKKEAMQALEKGIEKINSLSKDLLRKYKREQRNLPQREGSRGAGIGLIQAALLSEHNLKYAFRELSGDYMYYYSSVMINKSQEEDII